MEKASKKPLVSVVVATYNGEKYIKEQMESILNNIGHNDEVIVSDDGSTDNTISIIKKMNDNRIKIVSGPKKGVQQNFAFGLSKCEGEYIFLSDQDDFWIENKVSKVIETFESKKCLCVVHDAEVVNGDMSETIMDSYFSFRNTKEGFWTNFIKPSYLGCCMAIRKDIVKHILPIPMKVEMHDRWIGSVCDLYGKTVFLNEKLIKYRRHENNVSKMKRNNAFIIIKNRLYLLIKLLLRKLINR